MSRKTRKLIWSVPLVAVLAVAGALAMFVVLSPDRAQASHDALPGAPTDLMVVPASGDAGRTTLVLSWTAPSGSTSVDGYRIDYSEDNFIYMELVENTGNSGRSYRDSMDLGPGDFRVYRVFAINSAGVGPVSNTASGVASGAGTPSQVTGLTASAPSERPKRWEQIDLSWTAPSNGGSAITHYCIEVATLADGQSFPLEEASCLAEIEPTPDNTTVVDGTPYGRIVTIDASTTYRLTGNLGPSQTRLFRVYAVNSLGTSEKPSIQREAATYPAEDPAPPRQLAASLPAIDGRISLYWNWPAHSGGYDIKDFIVQVRNQDGEWADVNLNADGALTGTSAGSVTLADADINTGVVPAATARGLNQFEQPQANEGVANDTLYFRVFTHTDSNDVDAVVDGGEQRLSASSNMVRVSRKAGGRNLPVQPAESPTATASGRDTINLEWTHGMVPDSDPTVLYPSSGFRIDYFTGEGTSAGDTASAEWTPLWSHTNFTRTKFSDRPLKPGTERHYRIITFGPSQATSLAVEIASAVTNGFAMADSPTNLQATKNGAAAINLSWTAPTNTGGSEIKHYGIDFSKMVNGVWDAWPADDEDAIDEAPHPILTDGPVTSYAHTGLDENTRWRYQVRAVTTSQTEATGDWSSIATAQTDLAGTSDMPVGLVAETARDSSATDPGDRGVLLLWNVPESPDGVVASHYLIERKVEGEDTDYKPLADTSKPADADEPLRTDFTDFDKPDLAGGEVRYYRVTAVTGTGMGKWAEARYPADTSHQTLVRTSPTDLTYTVTGTTVSFSWTDGVLAADGHTVGLVDLSDYSVPHTDIVANGVQMHEYTNVAPGRYMLAVLGSPWMSKYYDIEIIEVMSGN